MRTTSILIAMAIVVAASAAQADITFDFNLLGQWEDDAAISSIMSSEFGAAVTTSGAMSFDYGSFSYIGTTIFPGTDRSLEVTFSEEIIGAQFLGIVLAPPPDDTFQLTWYNGIAEVGSFSHDHASAIFDSGWLDFGSGVDRLAFSNSGVHHIAIDDLTVRKADAVSVAPAPGAIALTIVGLGVVATALAWRKRGVSR